MMRGFGSVSAGQHTTAEAVWDSTSAAGIGSYLGVANSAIGAGSTIAQLAGGVGAAGIQAAAQQSAASTAAASANRSADLISDRYAQTRADLAPYRDTGSSVLAQLAPMLAQYGAIQSGSTAPNALLDQAYGENPGVYLTGTLPDAGAVSSMMPGQMTQAQLEATPGYQFTRDQGLQAVQASAAARGLGVSGAALKGAAAYATGLADRTYQDQFAIAQQRFADAQQGFTNQQTQFGDQQVQNTNQFNQQQQRFTNLLGLNTAGQGAYTNSFNRLLGLATLGQNSAAQTGTLGVNAANASGNYLTQAGQAQAAGTTGTANALAGGVNTIANAYGLANNKLLSALMGNNGSGGIYSSDAGGTGTKSAFDLSGWGT